VRSYPTIALLVALAAPVAAEKPTPLCPDPASKVHLERCYGGDLRRGRYAGDTACWPFAKTQRLEGVWRVGLESSTFTAVGSAVGSEPRVYWLEIKKPPASVVASMQGDKPQAFAVVLLGRRSLCPGVFGHAGTWTDEVFVDRLISLRKLGGDGQLTTVLRRL
jgi:hypothetical protein